ncbi:helix-turn-helix domain-containing protein [Paracoccus versutus]|nr:helix-turn-helix domain-containing protein [Paracoccus versutus]
MHYFRVRSDQPAISGALWRRVEENCMFGLTDEETAALVAARAAVQNAQSIVDRLERKIFDAESEAIRARRRTPRSSVAATLSANASPRQDFPKPASKRCSRPSSLSRLLYPPTPPPREAIIDTFGLVKSFGGLANTYSMGHAQTHQALRDAGINIWEEVARDWDRGISVKELSRRHGIGRDTVARWIRKTGRIVNPRNGNRRSDEALIVKTYEETYSVNKAAIAAGVAWAMARAVLLRDDAWTEKRRKPASIFGSGAETARQSLPSC